MKKFYTLAAAVAFCGISALALDGPIMTGRSNNLNNATTFFQLNSERNLSGALKHTPTLKGAVSRAEEEFDLREFTQSVYLDEFNNMDEQGQITDPVMSGCEVEWNYDEATGKVTLKGFLEAFEVEINVGEGTLSLPLGQLLAESGSYKYYTAIPDDAGKGIMTGEAAFDIYSNAVVYQGEVGVYVTDKTGKGLGWYSVAYNYFLMQPNATVTGKDSEGKAFETRIYSEYQMEVVEMETGAFDLLSLSNIMPFNDGFFVDFVCALDTEDGSFGLSLNEDTKVYHSEYQSDGSETGVFYLVGFENEQSYFKGMAITISDDKKVVTFDYDWTAWAYYSAEGYWFGIMEPLTITFDKSLIEMGGVADVAVDEEVNGPAKYYTIQGVEVANPTAGQIYIVKEGNKVTKRIIR